MYYSALPNHGNRICMFKRSDFIFESNKIRFVGNQYNFDNPNNLSKWEIATILQILQPRKHWCIIYHSFKKVELIDHLKVIL